MTAPSLHIVAFDIPFPANYGGVIDIYYKLLALKKSGVDIHLHCFQYGRERAAQLKKICKSVNYYKRNTYKNPFYGSLPYIVSSRSSSQLLENLKKDHAPILFEGLHTTYFLNHPDLAHRFKMVRMHNIEHNYYSSLEKSERSFFKKYFFRIESERLKKYQNILKFADVVFAISPNDEKYLQKKFEHVVHLPPFHGNSTVQSGTGTGKFVLYHGNLSVSENQAAALFLVNHVFSKLDYPCIIAGNNPSRELINAAALFKNIRLISDTTAEDINQLILESQINVLHTGQATGIKLKLINALFLGRHCIGNKEMIHNTGVEDLCTSAQTGTEYIEAIHKLWNEPFTDDMKFNRETVLLSAFHEMSNAAKLIDCMKTELAGQTKIPVKTASKNSFMESVVSYFLY